LVVVIYAHLRRRAPESAGAPDRRRPVVALTVVAALALAGGFTLLATAGQHLLPAVMAGDHYTPAPPRRIGTVWALSLVALVVLWYRRPWSVLDLWLMVVMCAWLFDIALAGMLNAGRFDLGFYAGRVYGLFAASFVLIVLLTEHAKLYAHVVEVSR